MLTPFCGAVVVPSFKQERTAPFVPATRFEVQEQDGYIKQEIKC